jgi:hypothetical protein
MVFSQGGEGKFAVFLYAKRDILAHASAYSEATRDTRCCGYAVQFE